MTNGGTMKKISLIFLFILSTFLYSNLNASSWKELKSFNGVSLNHLYILPSGRLLAWANWRDLYLNDMSGDNWKIVNPPPFDLENIISIRIGIRGEFYVYCTKSGIFKSTDEGTTWKTIPALPLMETYSKNGFAVNEKGELIMSNGNGLFISTDEGKTWEKKFTGTINPNLISTKLEAAKNVILSGHSNMIYFSKDGGDTWGQSVLPLSGVLSLFIANENEFYVSGVVYEAYTSKGILFRSTDGGNVWKRIAQELTLPENFLFTTQLNGEKICCSLGNKLFVSSDKGDTWFKIYDDPINIPIRSILVNKENLFVGGICLYKHNLTDGSRTSINNGFPKSTIRTIFEIDDNRLLISNSSGLFIFEKGKEEYSRVDIDILGSDVTGICRLEDRSLLLSTSSGKLYSSSDNGLSWKKNPNGFNTIYKLYKATNGDLYICAGGSGVFKSINQGETWSQINNITISTSIAVINQTVFLTNNNYLFKSFSETYFELIKMFGFGEANLFSINGALYITTPEGIYIFSENGQQLNYVNTKSMDLGTNGRFNSLFVPQPGFIWASSTNGVFESVDQGITWKKIFLEFNGVNVSSFVKGNLNTVYALSNNNIYEYKLMTNVVEKETLPEKIVLYQNYPNPFNPETSILFYLPKGEYVTIKVYDVLGKEVVVLLQEYRNPGKHTIFLNASQYSIPSGIYFYSLATSDYCLSKKLILLK